jgi:hypothetical protein
MPDQYQSRYLIPALEALLIEALEPRQNRKRGDDLTAAEYFQKADPAVEKEQLKNLIDSISDGTFS